MTDSKIQLLGQMRACIESDPSGDGLASLIIEQKELGLTKEEAVELLTSLVGDYRDSTTESEIAKEEGIDGVLDRVTGWCSNFQIYPDE
jgi:hypothetical protein